MEPPGRVETRHLRCIDAPHAKRLHDRLSEHAQDLGSAAELAGIEDLIERGNGAQRQQVIYEANHDLHELMQEIAEASIPDRRAA